MSNLAKLRQLSWGDRRLLVQSILLLPVIHFGLIILGYSRLHGLIEKLVPSKSTSPFSSKTEILRRAGELARIVSIAAEHGIYKATCLRKSLLTWWFLRKEGIESKICFGVRIFNGRLEAHAWVEYNGTAVNDSASVYENYHVLNEVLPSSHLGL